MADLSTTWERELLEQFSCLTAATDDDSHLNTADITSERSHDTTGLLHLSDEVLLVILRNLDPVSLLRLGSTCSLLFRDSFRVSLSYTNVRCPVPAKTAFRLVFMWRSLFRNIHCNRAFQEKLFVEIPFALHKYWIQWLVLEESVPLPSVRLPCSDVEKLWGITADLFQDKLQEKTEDCDTLKFEWRELYHLALKHHGSISLHTELESMYHQYVQCRFQWLFTYWLFRQPAPYNKQLRSIFLQWKKHSKRKVATWGETLCDVRYLASLHPVTKDYWRGQLARGDESLGIQTVGNYFSMCKSLVAWILGRDWGRLKRRKVYEDTLEGVYLLLRREMQETLVEHERFWQVAKVQMTRVCTLEETAANYVNWKMIETLPYYKLYLVSGNSVYLDHVQGFLRRKRLIRDWIYMEENSWARQLLPESLYTLLEFDTKISQESLHGDCVTAQLSRLMWLYLNSGQELYLQALKGMVLQCAHACLGHLNALQACQVPVA
ncbi:Transmembrane protein 177 [Labeo rohita]|uniref:Transmembrane protein 177 n=1 Tax=Labeo rohita TaxID=84645 RepID=A0ABQ8LNH3_LABRO|nr:Transmembrane protein 177 [Labeo rohita]